MNFSFDSQKKIPTVSIIISSLNNVSELKLTIDALINISYPQIELIIVDGGSIDGTPQLLTQYLAYVSHIISEPDKGIYDAWNKGLNLATGNYIAFLGAGDYYAPNGLQQLLDYAMMQPEAEFISSRAKIIWEGGASRVVGSAWKWSTFRRYMNVAHVGSLHSRALFDTYGSFDANYRIAGDYEFLLRPRRSLKAAYIKKALVHMQAGGASHRGYLVFGEAERAKIAHRAVPFIVARFDTQVARFKRCIRHRIEVMLNNCTA